MAAKDVITFNFMTVSSSIVHMYHNFFMQSPVYGLLGWLHVFAIKNSAEISHLFMAVTEET